MTVVFLPPIGHDERTWQWVATASAPGVARHLFPGFGGPAATFQPTMASLADEVAASYDGPLDLVGVSMGGMVALNVAVRHPGRVRSVLVACTGAAADPRVMAARARAAEDDYPATVATTLRRWFTDDALDRVPDHPGVALARQTLEGLHGSQFAAGWRAIAGHDTVAQLSGITVPVTAVAGDRDDASPVSRSQFIAEACPDGRLVVVPGAPHMIHLEAPDEFDTAVVTHLARVPS